LIKTLEPITGIALDDLFHHGLEDYRKYVELSLKLVAGMMKEVERERTINSL